MSSTFRRVYLYIYNFKPHPNDHKVSWPLSKLYQLPGKIKPKTFPSIADDPSTSDQRDKSIHFPNKKSVHL